MIMSDKFMLLKFIGHKNRGPYSCSKNKYAEKARGTNPKRVFNHRNPPSIIFLSFEMVCVQVIASLLKRTKAARERHAIVASLVATDPGDSSNKISNTATSHSPILLMPMGNGCRQSRLQKYKLEKQLPSR